MTKVLDLLRADWAANKSNYKGRVIVTLYRLAHRVSTMKRPIAGLFMPYVLLYKVLTEFILGVEIHWRAEIGAGLRVYHGYGLVVNSDAVLGRDVVLRHGVTIGHTDKGVPRVGNRVNFGAGAVAIGPIVIGDDAVLGAGAVVTRDVPSGTTWVGNPARPLTRSGTHDGR